MTRKELITVDIQGVLVNTIITVLTEVELRFAGKEDAPAITAALTRLKASRSDKVVQAEALAYCTDNWIFGPIH